MLCGNYILSNRSEWTFYFLSSVQFNFTIGVSFFLKNKDKLEILTSDNGDIRFFNKMIEYANKEFAIRMEMMNPNYKAILAQEQTIPPDMVLGIFDINIINVVLQLIKYNDELSPADMRRYIAGYLTRTPLQFLGLMK